MLTLEGVHTHIAQYHILQGVSFAVPEGGITVLLGRNGAGKTTTLRTIMGLWRASRGSIVFGGESIARLDTPTIARRGIALVPENMGLFSDLTVQENLVLAARSGPPDAARLEWLFGLFPPLRTFWRLPAGNLSGGQKQMLSVARALIEPRRLILIDEPTKGLDAARRDDVVRLLRKGVEHGGALLTITHDFQVARALGGDIAIMLDGRFVETGPAEQVLSAPRHAYTSKLLGADPAAWPEPGSTATGDTVLAAEGIGKRRGGRSLFEGLDIELAAGEIVTVSGPSGCGKSTLGSVLLGLLQPDTGRIRRNPTHRRERYQKLYQDPPAAFSPHVSLRRSLLDLLSLHRLSWERIEVLMPRLNLAPVLLDRRPGQVSGGELQRFALLCLLLLDPVFIFADEPTSRLDPLTQKTTIALLREIAASASTGILLVTHDPSLAAKVARRHLNISSKSDQALQKVAPMALVST
ncbi:MAG: ABC transporter ATP-binding protein [Rhizobiales bacterium]|nr:ABC transporter ATP-binding protein [Hyphomicrobiales bacterium]